MTSSLRLLTLLPFLPAILNLSGCFGTGNEFWYIGKKGVPIDELDLIPDICIIAQNAESLTVSEGFRAVFLVGANQYGSLSLFEIRETNNIHLARELYAYISQSIVIGFKDGQPWPWGGFIEASYDSFGWHLFFSYPEKLGGPRERVGPVSSLECSDQVGLSIEHGLQVGQ